MKYNILLITLFLPNILFSQDLKIDEDTGLYSKSSVIEVEKMTKTEIYKKALEWLTLNYKSANDVIQLKDEESGKIILKGNFSTGIFLKEGFLRHTLILDFKDERFRYNYTSLSYYSPGSGEIPFEKGMALKKKILAETESKIDDSIKSLSEYIIKNKSKEDW